MQDRLRRLIQLSEDQPLILDHFYLVLVILVAGAIGGLVTQLLECLTKSCSKKKETIKGETAIELRANAGWKDPHRRKRGRDDEEQEQTPEVDIEELESKI